VNGGAARILLVDDDRAFRRSTAELLRQDGYAVQGAADGREAVAALAGGAVDLVILDLRMPGMDGLGLVEVLRTRGEGVPILMISGFGTIESAVESIHLGADDFLTKPVDPSVLSDRVARLLERRPSAASLDGEPFAGMIGRSRPMRDVFDAIRRVAPAETTVLVTGETGTGKELVARAIHAASPRAGKPFVAVNCASLSEGLLESELFGHVRGAFTGAVQEKRGLFSAADGGTMLLDEIGDVGLRLQLRLLRALQEREVTPVGAVRPVRVDARVIAASNRDLRAEMEAGRLREDLYYRLNVFRIPLPPLRDRRGDIPLLVEAALRRVRDRSPGASPTSVSPFAMRLLQGYAWPGNVRELFAVVESASLRADGSRIEAQHLPEEVRDRTVAGRQPAPSESRYQRTVHEDDECASIIAALEEAGGVRKHAARILGMSRTTLWRKIREYGLEPD
jgi:DNA-binding NtrC family response regulator